jgi:hypothetical protein
MLKAMPRLLFVLTSFPFLPIAVIASSGSSGPAVGTIAPDFSARNLLTGEKIPLGNQRGKVVILTFWGRDQSCPRGYATRRSAAVKLDVGTF